ncbi:MAG: hypothetical protein ACI8WT_001209 [Clostridium sp.]|jgi:hypothetical protein
MQFDKNIFMLFNRDDFVYRKGDEGIKKEYVEGFEKWALWCNTIAKKVDKFELPIIQSWQNSGQLARQFWTRLKFTPFMESAACVSMRVSKESFTIELNFEFKNGSSSLLQEEYNKLLLENLKNWANTYNVDLDLFYIYVKTNKCTLKEYFNSSEKINWFANTKGININIGVYFGVGQVLELDTEEEKLIDILEKLSYLYEKVQKPNQVYSSLKDSKELIPDEYDGSYELVREIVKAYENVPYDNLTLDDLNAMFFMCIGTFKQGVETKKQFIGKSNLPENEKNRILDLINKIVDKSKDSGYTHTSEGHGGFGMFGEAVGSLRASYKDTDEITGAKDFIKLCISINKINEDEEIFTSCEMVLKAGVKGMQTGKISKFLHCLKPYTFPIINERQGKGTSVYDSLGIKFIKADKAATYIENARVIKNYRDKYFKFKNYRIMDIVVEEDKIKPDEINTILGRENPVTVVKELSVTPVYNTYSKEQFLEDAYITEDKYKVIINRLEKKKNIILQGAPGVGKSYLAKKIAYSILGTFDVSKVQLIQFHQSYSYEDFIMGYRPNKEGGFDIIDGVFYKFCKKAIDNPNDKFFFIIDEINRGNLSKIFGELMLLIEHDKRGINFAMSTVYSEKEFYIPDNLYIIGLMNTADRSLALLDYALRRRFSFIDIEPAFGENFIKYTDQFILTNLDKVLNIIKVINDEIEVDESLGKGFKIGHSYFCNLGNADNDELLEIIDCEIIPLLEEYWIENNDKIKNYSQNLREAVSNE